MAAFRFAGAARVRLGALVCVTSLACLPRCPVCVKWGRCGCPALAASLDLYPAYTAAVQTVNIGKLHKIFDGLQSRMVTAFRHTDAVQNRQNLARRGENFGMLHNAAVLV